MTDEVEYVLSRRVADGLPVDVTLNTGDHVVGLVEKLTDRMVVIRQPSEVRRNAPHTILLVNIDNAELYGG